MILRGLFSLNFAAIWFGDVIFLNDGASELPGACAPDELTPPGPGFVPIHECWSRMLKCAADLVKSGRALEKTMKFAAWRNNRYRQSFEPTVAFWGYLAGVPWPNEETYNLNQTDHQLENQNETDTPLKNLVANADHDAMQELKYSTDKVSGLLDELEFYSGVKPKKRRKWFHPPPPPEPVIPTRVIGEQPIVVNPKIDPFQIVNNDILTDEIDTEVPESRKVLSSTEPLGRNASDFFWHPKPNHVDIEGKQIVHGRQIEKMIPDQRLDGHEFNPALETNAQNFHKGVWTDHSALHKELGKRDFED